ncbi:hypothetical protein EPI10_027100 [Gossypium australe]|uniref:Uncharacterized protein n=1 Tax=Gossypium australe TaxID=47621 RepID=A0A5B6UQW5_9ROSI|nr:hypothetical protein EPI10_027100 [Gossypium australe]
MSREYSVVEQLHKHLACISVLVLLLNSEIHRNALIKLLNETYVADDISVIKLDHLIGNISADNFISFSDDEIPPGGMRSTKALHITTRCKGYMLPGVLIDNGSVLNVLPLSTLNRLPIDSSYMKTCQNIVRAFDGTERKVMGRIEIPLLIGPNTYKVDFLVMDIRPFYNGLLGRPWIHSTGVVTLSLQQKLKLVTEGQLITINAEKDIIASVTSDVPYIENNTEAIKCSFRLLEFVNVTFIIEGGNVPVPKISKATWMSLRLMVGKGALPGRRLGKYLHGRVEVLGLVDKRDRFGLGHRPNAKQRKEEVKRKQERRMARLSWAEIHWFLWVFFRTNNRSPDIHVMSNAAMDPELPCARDMCLEGSQDFIDDGDCSLSPDLLRMVEWEEKLILAHKETIENVILEEGKEVKIGTCINEETRQNLVKLLLQFKDVFTW